MSDRRKSRSVPTCVYCACRVGDTRDHVPPKLLYVTKPKDHKNKSDDDKDKSFAIGRPPPNWPTVPCCTQCNGGFSVDEQYFLRIVVGLLCHTSSADELFDGAISRSFDKASPLEDEMFDSLLPLEGRVALNADFHRIFRIAAKITCGLQALYGTAPYAPSTKFWARFIEAADVVLAREIGDAFSCEPLNGTNSGWKFSIHNSVLFEVAVKES